MMSDISNYKISLDDQLFFINSTPIAGVQSVQFSSRSNIDFARYLGQKKYHSYANGIQGGTVSIDTISVTNDNLIPFTGESGFNGYIIKNKSTTQDYGFASGYLTSYVLRGSINSPVQRSLNIDVFGNYGTLSSSDHPQIATDFDNITNHNYIDPTYKFAHPHYNTVTCNDVESNRLQEFELNIQVPRIPTYYLGFLTPSKVASGPLDISLNVQFEIDDYTLRKSKNKSTIKQLNDVTIQLKNSLNQIINTYNFNGMELVSEDLTSSNNGFATVSASYRKVY